MITRDAAALIQHPVLLRSRRLPITRVDGIQVLSFGLRTHDVELLRPRGGQKLHRKWRDDSCSVTF